MYLIPIVVEWTQFRFGQLRREAKITTAKATKSYVVRRLDDRKRSGEETNINIRAISCTKLLAGDDESAGARCAYKYAPFDGPEEERTASAVIHCDSCTVIQNVNITVLAI